MEPQRHVVTSDPSQALKLMADLYSSRFIGIRDLKEAGRAVVMTIKGVLVEKLEPIMLDGRRIEGGEKGILVFDRPTGKSELILNKTSWRALQRAWGKDAKAWIGSKVSIQLGRVNGKEATLVTPVCVNNATDPIGKDASKDMTQVDATDDLEFPENKIPEGDDT